MLPTRRTARIGADRAPRLALAVGLLALFLASIVSCGASIQAVYEGDVRFEHCMALDARADVPRGLRMTCWGEWRTFYAYGQTRDRIEYARGREKALSEPASIGDAPTPPSPPAVPDPTSVLVPPPMMLAVDGGLVDAAVDAAVVAEAAPPPAAACSAECEHAFRFCQQECKTSPCEKTCAAKYKRCMHRCF